MNCVEPMQREITTLHILYPQNSKRKKEHKIQISCNNSTSCMTNLHLKIMQVNQKAELSTLFNLRLFLPNLNYQVMIIYSKSKEISRKKGKFINFCQLCQKLCKQYYVYFETKIAVVCTRLLMGTISGASLAIRILNIDLHFFLHFVKHFLISYSGHTFA